MQLWMKEIMERVYMAFSKKTTDDRVTPTFCTCLIVVTFSRVVLMYPFQTKLKRPIINSIQSPCIITIPPLPQNHFKYNYNASKIPIFTNEPNNNIIYIQNNNKYDYGCLIHIKIYHQQNEIVQKLFDNNLRLY